MTNQELKEKMVELKYAIIDCENRLIIKKSEEEKYEALLFLLDEDIEKKWEDTQSEVRWLKTKIRVYRRMMDELLDEYNAEK